MRNILNKEINGNILEKETRETFFKERNILK